MIKASKIIHRDRARLKLDFPYNTSISTKIKQISDARWSQTIGAWHIPFSPEALAQLKELFPELDLPGAEEINQGVNNEKITNIKSLTELKTEKKEIPEEINLHIGDFRKWMEHKRYSASTIDTYTEAVRIFLNFVYPKKAQDVEAGDMVKFVNEYIIKNKLSYSYQNQVVNGAKLFFKEVIKSRLDVDKFERPRSEHKLPNVLSKEEVGAILSAPKNTKHKVMLSLIYACGLRRSELLNLKPANVDSKRRLLIIINAKGKKDRVVPISDKIIEMLRNYYKMYKPKVWLFEGQTNGERYSETSLQEVLKTAISSAKIRKPVSLHWLRHSYATHLLESGVDLRYIQELLGHKSSKTTEIYTHVSTKNIQKIISPFDSL